MKEIAFIADDFGRETNVNAAILEAYRDGGLTGASLMPGQSGTEEAIRLAREHCPLQIGWHVHLCDSTPTTCALWPWGRSPLRAVLALGWSHRNRGLIRTELRQQWELFRATGLPCRFINSHHHLHLHPMILREIRAVTEGQFDGWLRGFDFRLFGRGDLVSHATRIGGRLAANRLHRLWSGRTSASVWGIDRLRAMNAAEITTVLKFLPDGLHEFIFHPRNNVNDADWAALLQLRPIAERPVISDLTSNP